MSRRGDPENARRTERYRKDASLEQALAHLNDALAARPLDLGDAPVEAPVVLVVGPPRAGTTLLMQLLTSGYSMTFPDNVVARFWGAPEVGVLVSRSLRAQLGDPSRDYVSDYGVTRSLGSPHEFGYFWQRFFDFEASHWLSEMALEATDWNGLRASLGRIERAGGGAPLLFKAVALSQIVGAVARGLPSSLFVEIRRELPFVARSMLRARADRYGDARAWWSVRPRDHARIAALPPAESVAAQLVAITETLRSGLATIDASRRVVVRYDDLCRDPVGALASVARLVEANGGRMALRGTLPESLPSADVADLDDPRLAAVARALREVEWSGAPG